MQIKDLIPWARKDDEPEPKVTEEHPVAALQRHIGKAFDAFWSGLDNPAGGAGWWAGNTPRSDVVETEDAIEISIELPGMDQRDVEVSLAGDSLTIKGEKKVERESEKRGYYVSERSYGSVYRTIPLPAGVDADKAEATYKNGVLTVRVPQTAESRANVRRIDVKAA